MKQIHDEIEKHMMMCSKFKYDDIIAYARNYHDIEPHDWLQHILKVLCDNGTLLYNGNHYTVTKHTNYFVPKTVACPKCRHAIGMCMTPKSSAIFPCSCCQSDIFVET